MLSCLLVFTSCPQSFHVYYRSSMHSSWKFWIRNMSGTDPIRISRCRVSDTDQPTLIFASLSFTGVEIWPELWKVEALIFNMLLLVFIPVIYSTHTWSCPKGTNQVSATMLTLFVCTMFSPFSRWNISTLMLSCFIRFLQSGCLEHLFMSRCCNAINIHCYVPNLN